MKLLVNDLSVHGQFHDFAGFREALCRLMALQGIAKRYGRQIQCHRGMFSAEPMPGMTLQKAVGNLEVESQRRAVMVWLTKSGPFWDDARQHGMGDWLECGGEIVTDTAVGEAAFRKLHEVECGLVSMIPSRWLHSPLVVIWNPGKEEANNREVEVGNWWEPETLAMALQELGLPVRAWDDLCDAASDRFTNLVFAKDCFKPLSGVPFVKSAADRFVSLLSVLDRFSKTSDDGSLRDVESHRMYRDHFTGERAWFSDSSDTEKRKFRHELTFPNPEDSAKSLFCSWHGKISHQTLRLHFSWPVDDGKPVYVVYAGPKITKR